MIQFEHSEDKKYFEKLLMTEEKSRIEDFKALFDFRSPIIKRAEFNQYRKNFQVQLIKKHGRKCMLAMECCDLDSGLVLDHLIPLSSNMLNKELRNLKPDKHKKVKSQSFGSNHMDNLIIACNKCNSHKKHRFLESEKILKILIEKRKRG